MIINVMNIINNNLYNYIKPNHMFHFNKENRKTVGNYKEITLLNTGK